MGCKEKCNTGTNCVGLVDCPKTVYRTPGTTNPNHLTENIGALNIEFSNTELKEISASLDDIPTIGFRTKESAFENL